MSDNEPIQLIPICGGILGYEIRVGPPTFNEYETMLLQKGYRRWR